MSAHIACVDHLDLQAVRELYASAFPDEDLFPLVRELLGIKDGVLHYAAHSPGNDLLGHACFTQCQLQEGAGNLFLLGPVAVEPENQKMGIGSHLITSGIDQLRKDCADAVLVLGDPAYYGRFGFTMEAHIQPPHAIPEDWFPAWQSLKLRNNLAMLGGKLQVPQVWQPEALWLP